jgi:hypothetical protein
LRGVRFQVHTFGLRPTLDNVLIPPALLLVYTLASQLRPGVLRDPLPGVPNFIEVQPPVAEVFLQPTQLPLMPTLGPPLQLLGALLQFLGLLHLALLLDAPEQHVGELRRVDGSFELEPLDDKA